MSTSSSDRSLRRRLRSVAALAVLFTTAAAGAADHRHVFVTSVSGDGDLGSWPDAGGATGLAAGDAICQARATAAGLPNAGAYRAWLSDSLDDAYCRVHGLTGKKSANCGQPSLPAAAGPWLRTDGSPFGESIAELIAPDHRVLMPARRDESGAPVYAGLFTGTFQDGAAIGGNCLDWSSASGSDLGWSGSTERTSGSWTSDSSASCGDSGLHLLCFEIGVGDPLPAFLGGGRLTFLTSATGPGELGAWPEAGVAVGLAAGDAICQSLAAAASLPDPQAFKAWLSDASNDARDRFVHDGHWIRLDGAPLAADLTDLTDGELETALNLTETGAYRTYYNVWTGTLATGTRDSSRCADWTDGSSGSTGRGGAASAADSYWTLAFTTNCDFVSSHLYCLQDLPDLFLFADGFDLGDTSRWSASMP